MLQSYQTLWESLSFTQKKDFFKSENIISPILSQTTKKAFLTHLFFDVLNNQCNDILEEVYFKILNYKEKFEFNDMFEIVVNEILKLQGEPIDNYWVYQLLHDSYNTLNTFDDDFNPFDDDIIELNEIDNKKQIDVCIKAFNECDNYIGYFFDENKRLMQSFNDVGTLPDYLLFRDALLTNLINANRFEDALHFENDLISMGMFPDVNGYKRLQLIKLHRLNRLNEFLIANNNIELALKNTEEIMEINFNHASNNYKQIANYHFNRNEKSLALEAFKKAFELNPKIDDNYILFESLSNETGKNISIENYYLTDWLLSKFDNSNNIFEKINIAEQLYNINELRNSIDIYSKLIHEDYTQYSIFEGIAKTYKKLGKEEKKLKNYDIAMDCFLQALNAINSNYYPTREYIKQKDLIEKEIESLDKSKSKKNKQ